VKSNHSDSNVKVQGDYGRLIAGAAKWRLRDKLPARWRTCCPHPLSFWTKVLGLGPLACKLLHRRRLGLRSTSLRERMVSGARHQPHTSQSAVEPGCL